MSSCIIEPFYNFTGGTPDVPGDGIVICNLFQHLGALLYNFFSIDRLH
jgi:hypothetical protein